MPSRIETILAALATALAGTGVLVKRNEPIPVTVPAGGLIILRDGEPGEPFVTLSPLAYEFDHQAEIEVYVQKMTGREARIDTIKGLIGPVITGNRTLGGLCNWMEAGAPEAAAFAIEGAAPMLSHRIPLTINYVTSDPLA